MNYAVEMKHIEKSFGNNCVLKDVDFSLKKGSIHALLGENGTGKSTLMNILTGLLPCDNGEIKIENNYQVSFIHQELSLINDLTVYENFFLGSELHKSLILDRKEMIAKSKRALDEVNLEIDPRTLVAELSPSQKQLVEISRSLMKESKVIIMDEPTSSLSDMEIESIFKVMRRLQQKGISFIFISHKLDEVLKICDEYTVMRNGHVVDIGKVTPALTKEELSLKMVGKDLADFEKEERDIQDEVVLELKNLTKAKQYQNISMSIKRGEIIGVTGLMGDGRSELFMSVIGANNPYQGEVRVLGQKVNIKTTSDAIKSGIAYLPKNRKENAVIPDLSISDNMLITVMKKLSKLLMNSKNQESNVFEKYRQLFSIKYGDSRMNLITTLSGGNQQKVILARTLTSDPQVVILDNPTQGVDVGAKTEIYECLQKLASQGVSFVILSNEYEEIYKNCDRVYVMYEGKVQAELPHCNLDEQKVLYYAMGGKRKMG